MRIKDLASATGLLCMACVWTKVSKVDPVLHRPPLCAEAVTMYADSSDIHGEYGKIAVLSPGHAPDVRPSTERVRKTLRKKAARLGANGLILPAGQYNAIDIYDGIAVFVPADSARSVELCRGA